jgi:hypothetical protein
MGDVIVGNYDLEGTPASGNACLYNLKTKAWTVFDIGPLATAYGVWQTEPGGTDYVIAGGLQAGPGINKGYLMRYDSRTGSFGRPRLYDAFNCPGLFTHFEGITAAEDGFHIAASSSSGDVAFCAIAVGPDGAFGKATWTPFAYPGSLKTTGNTVYRRILMGIYIDKGEGVQSYAVSF